MTQAFKIINDWLHFVICLPWLIGFVCVRMGNQSLCWAQGLARLWRVALFTLTDFLALELHKPQKGEQRNKVPGGLTRVGFALFEESKKINQAPKGKVKN